MSGLIIICYTRSKRVNGKIICLCTSSDENLFTCKISGPKLLQLLSYASSEDEEDEDIGYVVYIIYDEDEDEESVKIIFTFFSYPVMFSSIFCMQLFFYLFSTLMSFKVRLRLKLKVKTDMYGYNAGPPIAITIYAVLLYCVILTSRIDIIEYVYGTDDVTRTVCVTGVRLLDLREYR